MTVVSRLFYGYDGIECREDTCVAISSIYLISGFVLKPNANPEKV